VQVDTLPIVLNVKDGTLMLAWEQAPPSEMADERSRVAARYVDTLVKAGLVFPPNRDPVGGVLTRQAEHARKTPRANVLQSD
jgi:hypothetical protein